MRTGILALAVLLAHAGVADADVARDPDRLVDPFARPQPAQVDGRGASLRSAGALLVGASAVTLAGSIYFIAHARELNDQAEDLGRLPFPAEDPSRSDLDERGHRANTVATAFGVAAVALLAGGGVLYTLGVSAKATPVVTVQPGGASAGVTVTF